MDTLEERNLNRLRNGKMMLAYSKEKKSFTVALLLTIMFGGFGIHRFYLGHMKLGFAYLAALALMVIGIVTPVATGMPDGPFAVIMIILPFVMSWIILIEICISYWVVGRENDKIKARLSAEYGVLDYKV